MKKIVFLLIVSAFLIAGCKAIAEEPGLLAVSGVELPDPGILPDSTFYFLKSWKESIQTFFTFGAENKAEQFMHLAEVRLAEYQKMIEKNKTEIARKTLDKYEKQLNQALGKTEEARERGKDTEKLKEEISQKILKHQEIFERILEKVPEEEVRIEEKLEALKEKLPSQTEKEVEKVEPETYEEETAGQQSAICIQVITSAVSPSGTCKEFPTPCDVPADWKKVDKCPASIQPKSTQPTQTKSSSFPNKDQPLNP